MNIVMVFWIIVFRNYQTNAISGFVSHIVSSNPIIPVKQRLNVNNKLVRKSGSDSFSKESVVQLVLVVNCVLYHFYLERLIFHKIPRTPFIIQCQTNNQNQISHNNESFGKLNFLSFQNFSIFFMMITHMTQADHNHCDIHVNWYPSPGFYALF